MKEIWKRRERREKKRGEESQLKRVFWNFLESP
jgi:hypothetical protein